MCCLLIPSYPFSSLLLLTYYFPLRCSSQGALMFGYLFFRLYQHVSIKNKAPCHIAPDIPWSFLSLCRSCKSRWCCHRCPRCRVSLGESLGVPRCLARRGSAVASPWVWAPHFSVTRLTADTSGCYCFELRKSHTGSAEALVRT